MVRDGSVMVDGACSQAVALVLPTFTGGHGRGQPYSHATTEIKLTHIPLAPTHIHTTSHSAHNFTVN